GKKSLMSPKLHTRGTPYSGISTPNAPMPEDFKLRAAQPCPGQPAPIVLRAYPFTGLHGVLDFTGLWASGDTRYMIEGDWHPTPLAHGTLAGKLSEAILGRRP